MSLSTTTHPTSQRGQARRVVLVDPYRSEHLLEIAELSGLPVWRTMAWPFGLTEEDRVLSTVPVPAGARSMVLGVLTDEEVPPMAGEVWPDRTLRFLGCEEDVLAYVMDRHAPRAPMLAVWSEERGLGVSTVAAALARRLAGVPLAVALVDLAGGQDQLLGLEPGLGWPDLHGQTGPFLPGRIDSRLPVWERVRVLAGPHAGHVVSATDAAMFALAASHDVVVVDCGQEHGALASKDISIELVRAGSGGVGLADGAAAQAGTSVTLLRGKRGPCDPGTIALPDERGFAAAARRGEKPGDRTRGSCGNAIRALTEFVIERL